MACLILILFNALSALIKQAKIIAGSGQAVFGSLQKPCKSRPRTRLTAHALKGKTAKSKFSRCKALISRMAIPFFGKGQILGETYILTFQTIFVELAQTILSPGNALTCRLAVPGKR